MRTRVALCLLIAPAAHAQLSYVESSAGLGSPTWDGGRTVLQFADLNSDGRLDLVTIGDHGSPNINTQMHGFTIWFRTAASWQLYQTGTFGYGGVSVGDVNNDGLPDLAYGMHHNYSATDLGNQVLEAALGDGTGLNWTPWDDNLGLQGQTYGMFGTALADLDADGWLDVASVSFGCCDGVHASRNNHDGSWSPILTQLNGNSSDDLVAGDANNDGYPDLATAHQSGTIRRNTGGTGFVLDDAGLPAQGLLGQRGPDLGDINGDGRDDLSFINPSGGVEVRLRLPAGGWGPNAPGLPAGAFETTRLADMDGDGLLDLVAFGNGQLRVFRGDGGTTWTLIGSLSVPSPGTYAGMAIADVDQNGRPDIALVSRDQITTFTSRNALRLFLESSASPGLSIGLQTPPVARAVRAGSTTFITWRSSVLGGGQGSTVDLDLSITGAGGPWLPLAPNLPNTGRYQWRVPTTWPGSRPLHLRATVHSGVASSESILGPIQYLGGPCYADCDASGTLNISDFICFQTRYALGDPYADCDANGTRNINDFICFQTQFALGCP